MTSMATEIRARSDFGAVIARAGKTRASLMRASGVSSGTMEGLNRPEQYGRSGKVRPATAWNIARAWASLTGQTEEAAFADLFVEVETDE